MNYLNKIYTAIQHTSTYIEPKLPKGYSTILRQTGDRSLSIRYNSRSILCFFCDDISEWNGFYYNIFVLNKKSDFHFYNGIKIVTTLLNDDDYVFGLKTIIDENTLTVLTLLYKFLIDSEYNYVNINFNNLGNISDLLIDISDE